ncbi:carboxymuconolactone decarboxylase family protein [Nocardia cyriacigeorgica]|uniref:carboxymuconolactone decarboxylase family protein n=1 Tax=Nocardia cyriacigeorgica TaxID=135487 RepID=UPI002B4B74BE|nr:carboxymuconolactone decarboxylase family protein [Nocardia cyriacigeorgica]
MQRHSRGETADERPRLSRRDPGHRRAAPRIGPRHPSGVRRIQPAGVRRRGTAAKTKQLIAVAVAHVTQCPYCIAGHTKLAHRAGAGDAEIMEAIWVAAEMRAGGAFAHSTIALHTLAGHDHDHTG